MATGVAPSEARRLTLREVASFSRAVDQMRGR